MFRTLTLLAILALIFNAAAEVASGLRGAAEMNAQAWTAPTFVVKAFHNSETVSEFHSTANVEFHCLKSDNQGKVDYVRGTYGSRGYFEGKVVDHTAYVSFYELTLHETRIVPSTGAAVLTYSPTWDFVSGPFWNSGQSNISNSYGDWGIVDECLNCIPPGMNSLFAAKTFCLWDPEVEPYKARDLPGFLTNYIYGEGDSNTFGTVGVGPSDTRGSTVGGYIYTYSNDDCNELDCVTDGRIERGYYGVDTISSYLTAGRLIAGTWNANSGPFKGQFGSSLYVIRNHPNSGKSVLQGFFCNSKITAEGVMIGECSTEDLPFSRRDQEHSRHLTQHYRALHEHGPSLLDRTQWFVNRVF